MTLIILLFTSMNEDGSKTLIKGTVENGTYSVIQKSFSQYALVEKGSTITDAKIQQTALKQAMLQ